jgi:hypothetical protein
MWFWIVRFFVAGGHGGGDDGFPCQKVYFPEKNNIPYVQY